METQALQTLGPFPGEHGNIYSFRYAEYYVDHSMTILLETFLNLLLYAAPTSGGHPENLSELEQRLFYTRVLCTNFSYLYQHLNTPAILENLQEKELIESDFVSEIKKYSGKHAQNALAICYLQLIKAPPNCIDKLCDTLQTREQDHVAERLLTGKSDTHTKSRYNNKLIMICSSSLIQNIRSWQSMATLSHHNHHSFQLLRAPNLPISPVPSLNY